MVKVEEIRKQYDLRIIQITQRFFAPFHDQFPSNAFQRIKYSVFFTVKNKKIYTSLPLSITSQTGQGNIHKTTKGHEVESAIAAFVSYPFGPAKALQAVNLFSEIKKSATSLSTISTISCSQMSGTKPEHELPNTYEYGK